MVHNWKDSLQCSYHGKSELPIKSQIFGLEAFPQYLPSMTTCHGLTRGMESTQSWSFHLSLISNHCPFELVFPRISSFYFVRKRIQCWLFLEHGPNTTVSWKASLKFEVCGWHHLNSSSYRVSLPFPFIFLCSSQIIGVMLSFTLKYLSWTFACESHPKPFWELVWG